MLEQNGITDSSRGQMDRCLSCAAKVERQLLRIV
jgi:hypothetical protein